MGDTIRCTIQILANGKFNILDEKGEPLPLLHPDEVEPLIRNKTIKRAEVTPLSTYLEINSGVLFINGVWVRLP